jgi:predicted Ser/Thr protein kinase
VPKVLDWSATTDNPVGSEYILMEEANGTQLGTNWSSMETDTKYAIVEELVSITTKLLSVSFSR